MDVEDAAPESSYLRIDVPKVTLSKLPASKKVTIVHVYEAFAAYLLLLQFMLYGSFFNNFHIKSLLGILGCFSEKKQVLCPE